MREALDLLEPHIRPEWLIPQFRHHVGGERENGYQREGQQQVLRATFPGIRDSVKELIGKQMDGPGTEVRCDSRHESEGRN